ncbi:argininosuccinate synthetase [Salvia divinorum]|uniref:Argininosuccinate synthetase n=1 Tax=Salvia divinorum TaxID=28513 RepID=A0ABD1GXP6_SALDI
MLAKGQTHVIEASLTLIYKIAKLKRKLLRDLGRIVASTSLLGVPWDTTLPTSMALHLHLHLYEKPFGVGVQTPPQKKVKTLVVQG